MFADIPVPMLERMRELEAIDSRDRKDGTPRLERLRQVPPETGRFLALAAAAAPPGHWVEIGTSAGYSAMWIALAARERGARLLTFEVLAEKARLARETFARAGVADVVELREGDAIAGLESIDGGELRLPRRREGRLSALLGPTRERSSCPAASSSPTTSSATRARWPTSWPRSRRTVASTRSWCRSAWASCWRGG